MSRVLAALTLVAACTASTPSAVQSPSASGTRAPPPVALPLIDAHLHYSQPAWTEYPPEVALAILERAGIRRAFLSSTPDDGTLLLYERAPDRIVPILRPYRTSGDVATWTSDATVVPYLEERLARGIHRGIGEVHLAAEQTNAPVVRAVARLAVERGLLLHVHGDDVAIEALLAAEPGLRVLWAHAGMSAGPQRVARLLDRAPTLTVELALRGSSVAPGGVLDDGWRDLFLRHPDRFLVGTDTWVNSQWERYEDIQTETRHWLAQLPADVAERIAWRNAERLAELR